MKTADSIIHNVRTIIADKGLKQKKVAEIAGYDNQVFSNMLNGRKAINSDDVSGVSGMDGIDHLAGHRQRYNQLFRRWYRIL